MASRLYPAFLDLDGRAVLVVGGGRVAARKVSALLDTSARITVLAPSPCDDMEELAQEGRIVLHNRPYRSEDMSGACLVIAATDDHEVNHRVSADAADAGVFCNVVDDPDLCSFQVPAVVHRGLLQIAVSTGGASPSLAKRIRQQLEDEFGPRYATLLDGLMELRQHVQEKHPRDAAKRRQILKGFLDSPAPARLLEDGDEQGFRELLEEWKNR